MSQAVLIRPDLSFTNHLIASGGVDVTKCMQCATCSAVCELSPDDRPFPRKEILWSQWGLKDRLLSNPDVWLCHNCGDCSVKCPRGASPGTVLSTLRRLSVQHFAVPSAFGTWMNKASLLPLLLVVPAVLLALALALRDPIASALALETEHGEGMLYASLFPHWLLISFFSSFLAASTGALLVGVVRFWKSMKSSAVELGQYTPIKPVVRSILQVMKELFLHQRFGNCQATRKRKNAHLLLFYGFLALFLVTIWAVTILYVINPMIEQPFIYPFSLWNPAKVLANTGALALVIGCAIVAVERLVNTKAIGKSSEFDWTFLLTLLSVGVTGLITESLRFAGSVNAGYTVYFIHLVLAFVLLIYLPYSKFSHIAYRTTALVFAEHVGRTPAGPKTRSRMAA